MKKEDLRTYKISQDEGVRTQRAIHAKNEKQLAQLKAKRAEYRAKQTEIIEKRLEARANRRNLNVLTEKQMRQKEMQTKKAQEAYKRLKYKKGNQDIAFKNVLDEGNKWQTNFVSSNVWKFKTRGNNLLVGFLNGNVYLYFGVAKMFLGLLNAGSKGKWVGNQLRRKNVGYMKIL